MLTARRDWIQRYMQENGMKPPTDIKKFYEQFEVEEPLTPEQEALRKLQEEEDAKAKKKKKDKKPPKKKKKKDGDEKPNIIMTGPSEIVQKYEEQFTLYKDTWYQKEETENYDQQYDEKMAKKEVMPQIEEEFKNAVDEMIKNELENMRLLRNIKKKKGKKKKNKKPKPP